MIKYKSFSWMVGVSGALLLNGIGRNVDANTDPSSPIVSNISSADSHTLINGNPISNPSDTIHTITSSNTSTGPININDSYASGTNTLQSTNSFFHLSLFSLASGNTAIFSSGSNYSTNDIVWIDQTANIWGKVSADNNSNLYMFDPHGINFYNGSSVDVNGSFYMSNASNVHLGYYANGLQRDGCFGQGCSQAIDKLTASNPIEFGFLGSETGNLTVHGATMNQFSEDTQIELVGTGIDISNSSISIVNGGFQGWQTSLDSNSKVITDNQGNPILTPYADGLDIRLLSLAPNTSLDVPVNITNFHEADQAINNLTFSGNINISNSLLNAGGDGEQTIDIRGGGVSIDNQSTLISTNFGSDITRNSSGNDEVATDNSANVTSDLDEYTNEPDLDPNAKSINILATNQIDITSSKLLAWSSYDAAGSIQIQAPIISIDNSLIDTKAASANYISSSSLSPSDSNYMNNLDSILALNAINNNQNLIIDPKTNVISVYTPYDPTDHNYSIGSVISSFSSSSTAGAGDITINASNTLTVTNNSNITSSSYVNTNAGKIGLSSGNDLKITGSTIQTNILTNGLSTGGTAGDISISSKNGNITLDSTQVESNSLTNGVSGGNAGNITINTPGNLTISNSQKNPNSNISTNTDNNGKAGDITLAAASIKISDGKIQSNSKFGNSSAGQAGSINANAISGDILLANSTLSTDILGGKSGGSRGDIILNAPGNITLDKSKITSDTSGGTDAGNIAINSSGSGSNIKLSNGSVISSSSNSKDTTAGSAGQIKVAVNQGALSLDKSNISTNVNGGSSSTSKGIIALSSKGAITLTDSSPVSSQTGSHVTADSSGGASAGDISLTSSSADITVSNSSEVSSSSKGAGLTAGQAGSINILSAGGIQLAANSKLSTDILGGKSGGTRGDIILNAPGSITLDNSKITSDTSGAADAGNISVNSSGSGTNIKLSNGSVISSSSNSKDSTAGSAGQIKVAVNQGALSLDKSNISTNVNGGSSSTSKGIINLSSKGAITLTDSSPVSSQTGSHVTADSSGGASAGDISLTSSSADITVSNSSEVSSSSKGAGLTAGQAGSINILSAGGIQLAANSKLSTDILGGKSGGTRGDIILNAPGNITLDNSKITSDTSGAADAGNISVNSSGSGTNIKLSNGSVISSSSNSKDSTAGSAGQIKVAVNQGALSLDKSNISTNVNGGSSSTSKGIINLSSKGAITLTDSSPVSSQTGSHVTADSSGGASAGDITLTSSTDNITLSDLSEVSTSSTFSGAAGSVDITSILGTINIDGKSKISSSNGTSATPGLINLSSANNISILGGSEINTSAVGGTAGNIGISTGNGAVVIDAATIHSDSKTGGTSGGSAGNIDISSPGALTISNGTISTTSDNNGSAGTIKLTSQGALSLNANTVSSSSTSSGSAGSIAISSILDTLTIAGKSTVSSSNGTSSTAGLINLSSANNISILGGSEVNTSAAGGKAGDIGIKTGNGAVVIDSATIHSDSTTNSGLSAGNIDINSPGALTINNAVISTTTNNNGDAGSINLASQSDLNIKSNSNITSSSTSTGSNAGKAGFIEVKTNTGNIQLSNSSLSTDVMGGKSGGSRGDIIFNTPGNVTLENSTITAKTAGGSEAGALNINTGTNGTILMANNSFLSTDTSGQGSAGTITTNSSKLNFNPGSYFSSSTSGQGNAGTVIVNTGDLTIQGAAPIPLDVLGKHNVDANFTGIRSLATDKSTGQTGDITINATNEVNLSNGAQISIANDGTASVGNTVSKHKIDLTAHSIFMKDSQILANSTGNVDASGININYSDQLNMDPSAISTSANTGNGGPINVYGGNMIWLQDSMIATSAVGGNGGPIDIRSNYIIPTNGFIQANTLANGGAGGTVNINTNALVPSESTLIQGGNILNFRPYSGINVIQASAPNGVGGALNITSPQLNLSGTLATILVQTIDPNALNQNMCAIDESSSLIMMGRGALHKRLDDGLISITVPHALDHQFD